MRVWCHTLPMTWPITPDDPIRYTREGPLIKLQVQDPSGNWQPIGTVNFDEWPVADGSSLDIRAVAPSAHTLPLEVRSS